MHQCKLVEFTIDEKLEHASITNTMWYPNWLRKHAGYLKTYTVTEYVLTTHIVTSVLTYSANPVCFTDTGNHTTLM